MKTGHSQVTDTAFQFPDGKVRRLHGNRAESDEASGMGRDDLGNVIIEHAREIKGMFGFGPIGEHHRNGRQDLDLDTGPVAVLHPDRRIPAVGLDLPEELVSDHHPGAAGFVVVQAYPVTTAGSLGHVRPAFRENMSMEIDLQHEAILSSREIQQ